ARVRQPAGFCQRALLPAQRTRPRFRRARLRTLAPPPAAAAAGAAAGGLMATWRRRDAATPAHNRRTPGKRLTPIATRRGGDGTTGLGDGTRVAKDHLRIEALGDVDELNSSLGVLLAEPLPPDVRELLGVIQHELF